MDGSMDRWNDGMMAISTRSVRVWVGRSRETERAARRLVRACRVRWVFQTTGFEKFEAGCRSPRVRFIDRVD